MKKFFVWLAVAVIYGVTTVGLKALGITLGAIPTIILLLILFAFARLIISAMDESKELRESKEDKISADSSLENNVLVNGIVSETETTNISTENQIDYSDNITDNINNQTEKIKANINSSGNRLSLPVIIIISLLVIIIILLVIIITNNFTSQQNQETSSLATSTTKAVNYNTQNDSSTSSNSKWDIDAVLDEARRIDTKNHIINSYEELMDRDTLLQKSYGKVESDDDTVVEITVSQQKNLYKELINDKDLIIDILGQEKYNEILNNTKKVEESNYFIDYVKTHK